jgi:hypothetical protein
MIGAIDRRHAMAGGAAALFAALIRSPAAAARLRDVTQTILSTAVLPGEPVKPWPFELFYDLSRFVTVRAELDRDLALAHFAHFEKEEWGWTNAAKFYATLRRELAAGTGSAPELLMSGRLSAFDKWFAQHILDAWYEGFYRYEGAELRVTYEKALMWDSVRGLVPVQGLSGAEYGYWTVAPVLEDRK